MARTKNRGLQQSFSPSYTVRRWRLGAYIRLSKEDLKKGKDDSNSVINQRDLLNDFYQKHIGEFESVSEYVDDGHTGTDANRENFQRLLSDVMSGKINCVVVKDLSRFARNYSDAGSLIDNLFVQMGVRFISLAENVDSYKNPDSVSNIIVPITNVMNDNYCYQTSKKIRQVFDYKRRNGQYIGAFAPYGYVKHPKDKHRLIVDPDAAETVKLIFTMLIQGSSKRAIALYLNEHGVPSPSAYKVQKGLPVSTRGYDDPMWGVRMIHSILTNPTYTGDLAQGRSRVKSYKVHQIEAVPREEWVEVAGTHEAIIDYETFDKVQALLQRDTRTSPKGREVHLFSGFLKCADCGRAITRSVGNNNNVYYACSTYKNRSRTACTMHSIKHNRLEAAVLFAVQQQIHLAVSYSEMIARINTAPVKRSQSIRLEELIAAKERELAKISRYKQSLYQDWKDGEITQQDYRDMKADYERQTIVLNNIQSAVGILPIDIRLNITRANMQDIVNLIDDLFTVHGLAGHVQLTLAQVVDYVGCKFNSTLCLDGTEYAQFVCGIFKGKEKAGKGSLRRMHLMPKVLRTFCGMENCMQYVIGADGELYKCEHSVGKQNEIVGDISVGPYFSDLEMLFYSSIPQKCIEEVCPFLPMCLGGCANERLHNKHIRDCKQIKEKHLLLLSTYLELLRN